MKIATKTLSDFSRLLDRGGSAINNNSGTVTLQATTNEARAYLRCVIQARAHELITARVLARRISGENGTSAGLAIDYPHLGENVNYVEIDSEYWEWYECSYYVPPTATSNRIVNVSAGLWTNKIGSVEIAEIDITVKNSKLPAARIHAAGLIAIEKSNISLSHNYQQIGIKNLEYNANAKELKVFTESLIADNRAFPIFNVNLTIDSNPNIIPKVGKYSAQEGSVIIKFVDVNSGQWIDIASLSKFWLFFSAIE